MKYLELVTPISSGKWKSWDKQKCIGIKRMGEIQIFLQLMLKENMKREFWHKIRTKKNLDIWTAKFFTHLNPCWAFLQFVGNCVSSASPIFLTSEHLKERLCEIYKFTLVLDGWRRGRIFWNSWWRRFWRLNFGIKVERKRIWIYELQIPLTHVNPRWAFRQFIGNCVNLASPISLTSEHLQEQLFLKVNKWFWSPQTVDFAYIQSSIKFSNFGSFGLTVFNIQYCH